MTSAKSLLENVLNAYNDTSLDLAGARSLATISGQFLDSVRQSSKTSAADLLWGQSLNDEADLYAISGRPCAVSGSGAASESRWAIADAVEFERQRR